MVFTAGGSGKVVNGVEPNLTPQTTSQFVEPEPGRPELVCSKTKKPGKFE